MAINVSDIEIRDDIDVSQDVDLDQMEIDVALNNAHRASDGVVDHLGLEPRLRPFEFDSDLSAGDIVRIIDNLGAKISSISQVSNTLFNGDQTNLGFPDLTFNWSSSEGGLWFDPVTGNWVQCSRDFVSKPQIWAGNWDGTNLTYGSPVDLTTQYKNPVSFAYDSINDRFVVMFRDWEGGTTNLQYVVVKVNWSTFGVDSVSPEAVAFSFIDTGGDIVFDPNTGKLVMISRSSVNGVNAALGTVNIGSPDSVTWSSSVQLTADNLSSDLRACWIPVTGQTVVAGIKNTTPETQYTWIVDSSGATPTFVTTNLFSGSRGAVDMYMSNIVYNETTQKVALTVGKDPDERYVAVGTPSVNSISWDEIPITNFVGNNMDIASLGDNRIVAKIANYLDADDTRVYAIEISGTSGDVLGEDLVTIAGTNNNTTFGLWIVHGIDDVMYLSQQVDSVGSVRRYYSETLTAGIKSLLTSGIVGILQENGLAGETKLVALEGHVSTVHSGLTAGEAVYIQGDGTIGHTESEYPYGIALSATEILVGDSHQLDPDIHYLQTEINITASQITDFDVAVAANTEVSANTAHRALTNNPHDVTPSQIWNTTARSSAYTAVAGDEILADTATSGAFQIDLPATPNPGDRVRIIDSRGNFNSANLTVNNNGENIKGVLDTLVLNLNGSFIEFVYINATYGWSYLFYFA